jgi:hypothetical protein
MNLSSTLNGSLGPSSPGSHKQNSKLEASFFNQIDVLSAELKDIENKVHDLQE